MTEKPTNKIDVGLWFATHDWVYWVLAIGGLAGLIVVLWVYFRTGNRKEAAKT
jgi:hypothetical protein